MKIHFAGLSQIILLTALFALSACSGSSEKISSADGDADSESLVEFDTDKETAEGSDGDADGETASDGDLDAEDVLESADGNEAASWEKHYRLGVPAQYELQIEEGVWQAMLADPLCQNGLEHCGSEYSPATLKADGRTFENVGVRFKGNSSLRDVAGREPGDMGYQRYSFKIKLDEYVADQNLDGLETLNLNNSLLDPSLMREVLSYELYRLAGVPCSAAAYVALSLNGAPYGLYVSVQEPDDKAFLEYWFGDNDGNMYKPDCGDLVYHGDDISDYAVTLTTADGTQNVSGPDNYVKKTNKDEADYSDIINLMKVICETPADSFEDAMRQAFDVDRFISFLAANTLIVALDGYGGGLPQNYYLYNNPSDGRFVFIPWDLNNSFGTFNCFMLSAEQVVNLNIDAPYCFETPNAVNAGNPIGPADRPLFTRLLENDSFRRQYFERISELLGAVYTAEKLNARIDEIFEFIKDDVAADTHPFFSYADFDRSLSDSIGAIPGLKPFIADRISAVLKQLETPVVCGDDACDTGENCNADCSSSCGQCQVYYQPASQCVPSCDNGCTCPATSPEGDPLICDEVLKICHPEGPAK